MSLISAFRKAISSFMLPVVSSTMARSRLRGRAGGGREDDRATVRRLSSTVCSDWLAVAGRRFDGQAAVGIELIERRQEDGPAVAARDQIHEACRPLPA